MRQHAGTQLEDTDLGAATLQPEHPFERLLWGGVGFRVGRRVV